MAVPPPAVGFGAKLRAAREGRNISLRQIANSTKISVRALEALERNDVSHLPGGIFTRAFVRAYAVEVGLDPEATIAEFIAQFSSEVTPAGQIAASHIEDNEAVESERRTARTFLKIIALSVPVIGVLLYFGSGARGGSSSSGGAPVPETVAAVPAPPATPTAAAAGTPPVPPSSAPTAATPAGLAGAPGVQSTAAEAEHLTIQISATRACWVSATVDGQRAIQRLLQPGEERRVDVRRELVITAGDAGAIAMTLNGAAARPLGKSGEVVTVRLNPSNFKTFLRQP